MQNEKVKVLMLTGPPGSGKNSMVELYCKRYNIQAIRYKDEQESRNICDNLGITADYAANSYPNDLESLIHFLRINAKA